MSPSANVTFAGNLADDPSLRTGQRSGRQYVELVVLVNDRNRDGDEPLNDKPTRHVVRAFRTNIHASLKKGDHVLVVGRQQTWAKSDSEAKTKRPGVVVLAELVAPTLLYTTAIPARRAKTATMSRSRIASPALLPEVVAGGPPKSNPAPMRARPAISPRRYRRRTPPASTHAHGTSSRSSRGTSMRTSRPTQSYAWVSIHSSRSRSQTRRALTGIGARSWRCRCRGGISR